MARLSSHALDRYPRFDEWLGNVFFFLFINNQRAKNAFWKWSNFSDTPENLMFFTYGTPPTLDLLDASQACHYNSDGTPEGVDYAMTWSAEKIGLNTALLDLFEDALAKPIPYSGETNLIVEVVEGTILHEMVHWSYFKTGVDEEKKYAGSKEYGTTNFELEAFGHPIRLPLSRLCKSKAVPFLGIKWDQQTVYSNTNFDIITVKEVQPGSPAAKAGIKPGNVFRKFDGEGIWPLPQGFSEQLQKKKPGDEVRLEVYQYGTSPVRIIKVTLGAYPVRK